MPAPTPLRPAETHHATCGGCGYLLRGLEPQGRCPECGLLISVSLAKRPGLPHYVLAARRLAMAREQRPAPLEHNSRNWLRCVALGPATLALLMPAAAVWQWWRRDVPWWERVPEYPLLGLTLVFAAAVWLTTWPDRPGPPPERRDPYWGRIRAWLRLTALTPVASAALACASEVVPAQDHPKYAGAAVQLTVLLPVLTFLLFDYLAYLSRRLEAPWFAGFFRLTMLVPTAMAAVVCAPNLQGGQGAFGVATLFPEFVGTLVYGITAACCSLGAVWCLVLGAALLDLSIRMWALAGDKSG